MLKKTNLKNIYKLKLTPHHFLSKISSRIQPNSFAIDISLIFCFTELSFFERRMIMEEFIALLEERGIPVENVGWAVENRPDEVAAVFTKLESRKVLRRIS